MNAKYQYDPKASMDHIMMLTVDFLRRYVVEPAHERGVSDERLDAITQGEGPTIEEVDVLGHAFVDLLRNDWSYDQNGDPDAQMDRIVARTVDFVRGYVVEPVHERGVSDERLDAITQGEDPTIEEVDVLGHAFVELLRKE